MNVFWLLLGSGPFFGQRWLVVDIFWLVVGGGGWWWVVVNNAGYILAGGGWWWMVVGGCKWQWMVACGGMIQSNPKFNMFRTKTAFNVT